MLARAPAREHGHAQPRRHGGVGVVVVSVGVVVVVASAAPRTCRRTASRRCSGPAGCCRPDPGRSRRRRSVWTSVSCGVTLTLKPGCLERRGRVGLRLPRDVGHRRRLRPVRHERLTVEPFVAVDDPLGTCDVTTPAGCVLSTSVRETAKPCRLELLERRRIVEADHGWHGHLLRPGRVVDPHRRRPRRAACPASRILGRHGARRLVGGHADALGVRPARVSAATASVSCLPTTSGTSTVFLPVETLIVTIRPWRGSSLRSVTARTRSRPADRALGTVHASARTRPR